MTCDPQSNELKIERVATDGVEGIRFTIGSGAVRLGYTVPSFLSADLVRLATDPGAQPFILANE